MDDEAFARMLQQQLLDEEMEIERQAQAQARESSQQPRPNDPYTGYDAGPYRTEHIYEPRPEPYYNQRPRQDHIHYQQPFDQDAYGRRIQPEDFSQRDGEVDYHHHYQQQQQQHRDQYGTHQARNSRSDASRPQTDDQYDPDLELAKRIQEMETIGTGGHGNYQAPLGAGGGGGQNGSFISMGSAKTRQEQEEEDARLARLIYEKDQSLRDINPDYGGTGAAVGTGTGSPPFGNDDAVEPTGRMQQRPFGPGPSRGHPPMMQHPNQDIVPTQPRNVPPQFTEPNHRPVTSSQPGTHARRGRLQDPSTPNSRSHHHPPYPDQRLHSQEFTPGGQHMGYDNFVPQKPPQFSGHPTTRQRNQVLPSREDTTQRSPVRAPASRDGHHPMPGRHSRDEPSVHGGPRPPQRGYDTPVGPAAMHRGNQLLQDPNHQQPGRTVPPRGRVATSPKRGAEVGVTAREMEPNEPPLGDLLPGDAFLDVPAPKRKEKKKKNGIFGGMFGGGRRGPEPSRARGRRPGDSGIEGSDVQSLDGVGASTAGVSRAKTNSVVDSNTPKPNGEEDIVVRFPIPEPVPRPADTIGAPKGPLPYSLSVSKDAPSLPEATIGRKMHLSIARNTATCAVCMRPVQNPLSALDKKYHNECFRCITCHELIDPTGAFAYIENDGDKQPMHRRCYAEIFGIKCVVCKQSIPAGPDGKVSFVKHPFFDTEQMCPRHARNLTRRCTGCHRFEPENEPFADLNDVGRCVCLSCCRSVIVDSQDAQPLWAKVVDFFEHKLNMPIWKDFREVPILVVGYNALNDQMNSTSNVHCGASQITTRGLCLTEHESGRRFRMNRMKFDKNNMSFIASDAESRGFTYFQVPDANKVNPDASVTAILCLSGLPRDLSASVLAHEATHAWIKLHPRFDFERPIPPQVEEGCAQLIALLFLNEGLDPPVPLDNNDGSGPSDEKLRQYFKFSIETDDHEIYGTGYRRAAIAYSKIGIEALMSHVVLYQEFPET